MKLGEWPTSSNPLSPLLLEGSAGSNPAEAARRLAGMLGDV